MRLPELCLKLGAATALFLLSSASPVHLLAADLQAPTNDEAALTHQLGWVHHQTLSKSSTTIRLSDSKFSHLPLNIGLLKAEIDDSVAQDLEEEDDLPIQILKADDDNDDDDAGDSNAEIKAMKQPSTPPKSLPSDPYAHYTYQEDLSLNEEFRSGRSKGRRTFILGDIHGSLAGLDGYLRQVKFNTKNDRLIVAGDVVAKGPQSLQVIDRLASLGAKCVRGNHDDKVLRWKGYLNSLSAKESLELEADSQMRPMVADAENSPAYDADVPNISPLAQKRSIPADLVQNSQHHQIAKKMTDKQYKYLVKCPLILTLPKEISAKKRAVHVAHAGIDPRRDIKHQEPWVLVNVRNILSDGTPSRKVKKGKGWADLFNNMHHARSKDAQDPQAQEAPENDIRLNHNYMIVYGHDAHRALNVQEWTIGLDTGCVYGRQLSGYVVETGKVISVACPDVAEDGDDD
ncbi:hypothetical protein DFQ27_009440 [Actinomortierella ambigua]|uniref:Calcineurin-like phosphoesterase domain-containing protein n=1 Tax=Actinomortierella ambigua TaxID=1343610 RepID=A0A9P6QFJ5_9FUNG|nr:hypothetical protein DFQ27_009440 [Actinomortierella ambigua]